jgi:hypothetical protein
VWPDLHTGANRLDARYGKKFHGTLRNHENGRGGSGTYRGMSGKLFLSLWRVRKNQQEHGGTLKVACVSTSVFAKLRAGNAKQRNRAHPNVSFRRQVAHLGEPAEDQIAPCQGRALLD